MKGVKKLRELSTRVTLQQVSFPEARDDSFAKFSRELRETLTEALTFVQARPKIDETWAWYAIERRFGFDVKDSFKLRTGSGATKYTECTASFWLDPALPLDEEVARLDREIEDWREGLGGYRNLVFKALAKDNVEAAMAWVEES